MKVRVLKSFCFQSHPGITQRDGAFQAGEVFDLPQTVVNDWRALVDPIVETAMVAGEERATHIRPRKRR